MATAIEKRVKRLEKVVTILATRGPGPDTAEMMGAKDVADQGDETPAATGGKD
jgi:hypothetical protein